MESELFGELNGHQNSDADFAWFQRRISLTWRVRQPRHVALDHTQHLQPLGLSVCLWGNSNNSVHLYGKNDGLRGTGGIVRAEKSRCKEDVACAGRRIEKPLSMSVAFHHD